MVSVPFWLPSLMINIEFQISPSHGKLCSLSSKIIQSLRKSFFWSGPVNRVSYRMETKPPAFLGQNPWTRRLAQCHEGTLLASFPSEVHPLIYQYWLALKLEDKPQITDATYDTFSGFGSKGTDPGQFMRPAGVAVDVFGNIFVTEPENNRIQVFDKNGVFNRQFGVLGGQDGQLFFPVAVCVDHYDDLVVVDRGNNRIQVFEASGQFKFKFGTFGFGPQDLWDPSGVAIDNQGNIIVSVEGHHRISIFSSSGIWLKNFGLKRDIFEGLLGPVGVQVDGDGNFIVCDRGNHRVVTFNPEGERLRSFGTSSLNMWGIAVDRIGNIIIADHNLHQLVIVDKVGQVLKNYIGVPVLDFPKSPVLDRHGNIIITNAGHHRIQIFQAGKPPPFTFDGNAFSE